MTSDRVERLQPLHPKAGTVGGGDVGLIDNLVAYITNANGEILIGKEPNPRRLTRTEKHKRLRRRRERKLSRSIDRARMLAAATIKTAKGDFTPVSGEDFRTVRHRLSKRQQRQSAVLSKELWQRSDQRDDFLHKISNKIALSAEIIVLEDLHVAGLLANRNLASSLSDAALGRLMTMIDYKAERAGGIVLRAPRLFPSTKRCFDCGEVRSGLKMSDREWTCSACGVAHDRDINAAKNLHWLGHLAMSLDDIPAEADKWRNWILESRHEVARWQAKKEFAQYFFKSELDSVLGVANSEFTRGEPGNRGERNLARNLGVEPRSILPRGSRVTFAY